LQITMEDGLLSDLDSYCDEKFMNRSAVISQAVLEVINRQKMFDSISALAVSLRGAVESGNIDDETKKQIESFEALSRLFIK